MSVPNTSTSPSNSTPTLRSIQNTVARPLPGATLRVLSLMCCGMFAWLVLGKVDIIAEAPGKLVPKTFVKVVQPQDAGILTEVLVAEGDVVKEGQVLARLDPVMATSDQSSTKSELQQADLQVRRIDAELSGDAFAPVAEDGAPFAAQALAQYTARRAVFQQQLATEQAGLSKLRSDLQAATAVLSRLGQTVGSYQEIADAYKSLGSQELQPKTVVLEKERDRVDHEHELTAQQYTVAGLRSGVKQSEQRLLQIKADYTKELALERNDALLKLEKARNELAKQDHRVTALELKAPVAGVIKDVMSHSAGTVLSPGTVLLTLVPANEPLRAEVWVKNEDAGFVFPGQAVQLKVATYPFQKYGLLHGKVLVLSPDAAEANAPSGTPGASSQGPSPAGPSGAPQSAQFRALVELDQQALVTQDKTFPLRPGMQVVAEANQGQRTVLEYLLSPIRKSVMEAARER